MGAKWGCGLVVPSLMPLPSLDELRCGMISATVHSLSFRLGDPRAELHPFLETGGGVMSLPCFKCGHCLTFILHTNTIQQALHMHHLCSSYYIDFINIPILQTRRLGLLDFKQFFQGHLANRWRNEDLSSDPHQGYGEKTVLVSSGRPLTKTQLFFTHSLAV